MVERISRGDLLDVNVWLALLNPQHLHHGAATAYWTHSVSQQNAVPHLFLCRVTQLAILRLTTNKLVMGGAPYTIAQAWEALQSVVDLPEVGFQNDPQGVDDALRKLTDQPTFNPADWTDAYLAAMALKANLRVVTFDKGFSQFVGVEVLIL